MIRLARIVALAGVLLLLAAPVAGQDLRPTMERVASAWHRGDAAAITALGAQAGISLDVDGRPVGPLPARQASAVLRRVFDERESVSVRTVMTRTSGGSPPRAFGEVAWTVRARGTTIPEGAKLFVAFVLEDGLWRVTEIRLIQ